MKRILLVIVCGGIGSFFGMEGTIFGVVIGFNLSDSAVGDDDFSSSGFDNDY